MAETPALEWMASGEEAELLVPSFARFRATYQGEGYYDDRSHGAPIEQDLYEVEIFDASSAGMPHPWSDTRNRTAPFPLATPIRTVVPVGLYLIAFVTRFVSA